MLIRRKLISGFTCVALFVAAVGYVAVRSSEHALRDAIGKQASTIACQIACDIDRTIRRRIEQFEIYARDIAEEDELATSNREFEKLDNVMEYIEGKDKAWKAAGKKEITPFMRELIDNNLSKEIREEFELKELYQARYGYAVFGEVFVTNKYGANVAQTQKTSDYYQADEEWWQKAKEDGLFVDGIGYDESADSHSMSIGVRIDGVNGEFLGVAKAVLNIDEVTSIMEKAGEPGGFQISGIKMLTADWKILFSTEEYEFLEDFPHNIVSALSEERKKDGHKYVVAGGDRHGESQELYAYAHRCADDNEGESLNLEHLDWILMVECDGEDVFAPVARLRATLVAISVIITVLAVLAGWLISRSISRPITKLQRAVTEVGAGDLQTELDTESNDEISLLSASFMKMVDDLKTTTTSVERLNKEIADREKVQEELKQSGEFLHTVLNGIGDAISIVDTRTHKVLGCNTAFLKDVGLDESQVVGRTCYELTHGTSGPCKPPDHHCPLAETVATGNISTTEHVHRLEDGKKLCVEVSTAPIRDENDKVIRVVHTARDITARKEAEAVLLRIRAALDNATDSIAITDRGGNLIYANMSFCGLFRQTIDQIGREGLNSVAEVFADRRTCADLYEEALQFGESQGELEVVSKSGRRFPAHLRCSPITDESSELVGILFLVTDISQRKRAEQEREKLLQDTAKRIKELRCMYGVSTSSQEHSTMASILQNTVLLIPLGWNYPEITQARVRLDELEYNSEPYRDTRWKQSSDIVVNGNRCGSVEVCYMEERPELDEGPFLKEERDLLDGIARVLSQAAERIKAEQAIKQAYSELEKANLELKEMQSQIVQSEKLASIGQLAAGVAHEMNTPVGFVASNFETLQVYVEKITKLLSMYSDMVLEMEKPENAKPLDKVAAIAEIRENMKIELILEDVQDLFDDSREGLERVTNIIQNLRDFSRIDQPGSLDQYNLNDGIRSTLTVAQNEIRCCAEIKTELAADLPVTYCNSGQINQVFLNILVNAAQAIKSQERDGNGSILIRTCAKERTVVCEISDDGPGIPADKLSKIFDPFYTSKPVGEGTGLGLTVSYDIIVHKHGGKLLVESEMGRGTKFTVELPIKLTRPEDVDCREDDESHCLEGGFKEVT